MGCRPWREAKVHILTHASAHYAASSVFEGERLMKEKFQATEHNRASRSQRGIWT
jgi:hypothetical protein